MSTLFPALLSLLGATPATGQRVVVLRTGAGERTQVLPGTQLVVPLVMDMTAAGGRIVGALVTRVSWDASRLSLDSVRSAGFGLLTTNTSGAATGSITVGVSDPVGTTGTVVIANVYLTATALGATTIAFAPMSATTPLLSNILGTIRIQNLGVCIAANGAWGDVNGDTAVNIIDAQQIARSTVGLGVLNSAAVALQGDVTDDGAVNIIDAQQIARFSVGLSASARINTVAFIPPTVSAISIASVSDATAGAVNPGVSASTSSFTVGRQAQIQPLALGAGNVDVTPCASIVYSSNSANATASSSGLISAVSPGPASITVSAGSVSTQVDLTVGSGRTYASTFPVAEAQISEDGNWIHLDPLQTAVKTQNGNAMGTQDGSGGFDDSDAYLLGFGPNYEVEATIGIKPGIAAGHYREVELLLRWTDTNPIIDPGSGFGTTHSNGYEVSFAYDGAYAHVGRFKGADLAALSNFGTPVTGDKFRARIVGQHIQVWWNATPLFDVMDDDGALMVADGNPGIGFFIGAGAANDEFYFSDVTVRELPANAPDSAMAGVRSAERRSGREQIILTLLAVAFLGAIAAIRIRRGVRVPDHERLERARLATP